MLLYFFDHRLDCLEMVLFIPMSGSRSETQKKLKMIAGLVVSQDGATVSCGEPDYQRFACHSALRTPSGPS